VDLDSTLPGVRGTRAPSAGEGAEKAGAKRERRDRVAVMKRMMAFGFVEACCVIGRRAVSWLI